MTDKQSFSVAVRRRPSYLNEVTVSSGIPYACNAVASPARASSSASPCLLQYVPRAQRATVMWRRLSATHGTNVLQAVQQG